MQPPPAFRGTFRTDPDARAVYAEAAGIQQILPAAVAIPATPDDIVELIRWARATNVSLVPRGSGTSMAGGAIGAGVVVDASRLRHIGTVDLERRRIMVGPGVRRDEIDHAAERSGLRLPVDPSSGAYCTAGGMVSTNAAGAHTLKYGSIRSWVTALDCVFADGTRAMVRRGEPPPTEVAAIDRFLCDVAPRVCSADVDSLRHRGVRKDSSGYGLSHYAQHHELIDVLIGSEGTLAIFVGVELSLCPRAAATASLLAAFPTLEGAVAGADAAQRAGASACELLDRTFLDLVRQAAGDASPGGHHAAAVPGDSEAVLLIELEGDSAPDARRSASALGPRLQQLGASPVTLALDPDAEVALWELRHAASPALARLDRSLKSMQFIEDGAVPPSRLADYVRGVRSALARHGVRGAIFGHAGDAHVHVNPLIDVRRADWRDQVAGLLADVTDLTARLGGTLTGEHGDGRLRAALLPAVWGGPESPALTLFAAVKSAFDPDGLLNPGVKVPVSTQPALDTIKYDPQLPSLPPAARRALDHVADARAYATPRLELLAL
jgi:FAD/FMN-containing dehydrogenase